ncbi:MAG: amphi-Trp domain-containing protein [Chloroflexota bacterium]|nr:amphi-Trp domain-containing protein [Chloroflexota bacterium]PLS77323.1 MAG: hypothetical protein CYG59_24460 [Chloroflexota bacterium]
MPQHGGQQAGDELGWYMEGSTVEVADILMEFAQELRNGDVNVWKGQRELHLMPEGRLQLRVDAVSDDDGREGLHLKLHWNTTSAAANLHSGADAHMGVPVDDPSRGMQNQ